MDYIIFIPIIIVVVLIIGFIIYLITNSKKNKETPASILDVKEVGVPSSAEFSYGYEKEETIVMNPINEAKESVDEFPDVSDEDELDITSQIKKSNESENE